MHKTILSRTFNGKKLWRWALIARWEIMKCLTLIWSTKQSPMHTLGIILCIRSHRSQNHWFKMQISDLKIKDLIKLKTYFISWTFLSANVPAWKLYPSVFAIKNMNGSQHPWNQTNQYASVVKELFKFFHCRQHFSVVRLKLFWRTLFARWIPWHSEVNYSWKKYENVFSENAIKIHMTC